MYGYHADALFTPATGAQKLYALIDGAEKALAAGRNVYYVGGGRTLRSRRAIERAVAEWRKTLA